MSTTTEGGAAGSGAGGGITSTGRDSAASGAGGVNTTEGKAAASDSGPRLVRVYTTGEY